MIMKQRHKHKRFDGPYIATRQPRKNDERGLKKGTPNRRIIVYRNTFLREYTLHSTKGYRSTLA